MKKLFLILAMVLIPSLCLAATLNLRATWTANTESDMASYELYRTDQTRVLIGTIPHPNTSFDFTTNAPDNEDYTLTFVLVAVDTAGNKSEDSDTAPFLSNLKIPAAPGGLGITKP